MDKKEITTDQAKIFWYIACRDLNGNLNEFGKNVDKWLPKEAIWKDVSIFLFELATKLEKDN